MVFSLFRTLRSSFGRNRRQVRRNPNATILHDGMRNSNRAGGLELDEVCDNVYGVFLYRRVDDDVPNTVVSKYTVYVLEGRVESMIRSRRRYSMVPTSTSKEHACFNDHIAPKTR